MSVVMADPTDRLLELPAPPLGPILTPDSAPLARDETHDGAQP